MMTKYPKVSVIILNWNGKYLLKDCFQSLQRIDYPDYELIMVDNGSQDGSIEYVKQNFPDVRILALDRNYGYAEGNNLGASIAKGELLVFLNNDTCVDKNWLIELVKPILEDSKIAICGSKVVYYNHPEIIEFAGGMILSNGMAIHVDLPEQEGYNYNIPRYTSHAYGAAMLIRRDIFQRLNGFDEDYFIYNEELDLCWRCWLLGLRVLFVPSSVMFHKQTGPQLLEWERIYYAQSNHIRNILKNFNFVNAIKALLLTLGFDMYKMIKHTYKRKYRNIKAILGGYFDVLRDLNQTLKKRKFIQSNRQISDKELMQLGLIAPLKNSVEIIFKRSKLKRRGSLDLK